MRWEPGRQGTGYSKLRLYSLWRTDCYILHYPVGSHVPLHSDPVPGRRHWRANLILRGEDAFWTEKPPLIDWAWLKVFRSDEPHSVGQVARDRWVLSFGLVF
jgi:hypothetical protein